MKPKDVMLDRRRAGEEADVQGSGRASGPGSREPPPHGRERPSEGVSKDLDAIQIL